MRCRAYPLRSGRCAGGAAVSDIPLPPDDWVWAGPPNDRLYKQGLCLICKIPLFGAEKKRRNVCGHGPCIAAHKKKYPCKRLTGPRKVDVA